MTSVFKTCCLYYGHGFGGLWIAENLVAILNDRMVAANSAVVHRVIRREAVRRFYGVTLIMLSLRGVAVADDALPMPGSVDPKPLAAEIDEALSATGATPCDDWTLIRRVTLDRLGRIPAVSEIRDFIDSDAFADSDASMLSGASMISDVGSRREALVEWLARDPGDYASAGNVEAAGRLADYWTSVLSPSSVESGPSAVGLRDWLSVQFQTGRTFDQIGKDLVAPESEGGRALISATGGTTAAYTTAISRGLLGVRMDCAQCHDHPFAEWKMSDFWGLAAYFGDVSRGGSPRGVIRHEGIRYRSKPLDAPETSAGTGPAIGAWLTDVDNPYFAANFVNRTLQNYVGRGVVRSVADLDAAADEQIEPLRNIGRRFAASGYRIEDFLHAVMMTDAYAATIDSVDAINREPVGFQRQVKVLSPRQLFASLEQALGLPVGRIDRDSARYNGLGQLMTDRLARATDEDPTRYVAGVPQALLMMNGPVTQRAVSTRGRLLAAVADAPFFETMDDRIDALFLATLSRPPGDDERRDLHAIRDDGVGDAEFLSDLLWTLLNSPEMVLCR